MYPSQMTRETASPRKISSSSQDIDEQEELDHFDCSNDHERKSDTSPIASPQLIKHSSPELRRHVLGLGHTAVYSPPLSHYSGRSLTPDQRFNLGSRARAPSSPTPPYGLVNSLGSPTSPVGYESKFISGTETYRKLNPTSNTEVDWLYDRNTELQLEVDRLCKQVKAQNALARTEGKRVAAQVGALEAALADMEHQNSRLTAEVKRAKIRSNRDKKSPTDSSSPPANHWRKNKLESHHASSPPHGLENNTLEQMSVSIESMTNRTSSDDEDQEDIEELDRRLFASPENARTTGETLDVELKHEQLSNFELPVESHEEEDEKPSFVAESKIHYDVKTASESDTLKVHTPHVESITPRHSPKGARKAFSAESQGSLSTFKNKHITPSSKSLFDSPSPHPTQRLGTRPPKTYNFQSNVGVNHPCASPGWSPYQSPNSSFTLRSRSEYNRGRSAKGKTLASELAGWSLELGEEDETLEEDLLPVEDKKTFGSCSSWMTTRSGYYSLLEKVPSSPIGRPTTDEATPAPTSWLGKLFHRIKRCIHTTWLEVQFMWTVLIFLRKVWFEGRRGMILRSKARDLPRNSPTMRGYNVDTKKTKI